MISRGALVSRDSATSKPRPTFANQAASGIHNTDSFAGPMNNATFCLADTARGCFRARTLAWLMPAN